MKNTHQPHLEKLCRSSRIGGMWKEEEYGQGKCINCGFLGKRDNIFGQECYTANADERTTGNLAHHIVPGIVQLDTIPWCFIGKANLKNEVDQFDSHSKGVSKTFDIITKDSRNCPWYPWTEYFSPKELFEVLKMQQLEDNRREFERKLTQMQIDASAEVSKAGIKVSKMGIWIGIGAGILAVAEVLTMTEDSFLWKLIANIVLLFSQ